MTNERKNRDLILLVSENEKLLCELEETLGDSYRIINARSVPEALSAVTLRLPNMFIADTELSHISGIDLLKKIREGIKTKLIPFVLLSSKDELKEKIEVMQIGADDYLSYPFNPEELKAVVRLRLNKFNEFYLLSVTDELTRLYNRKEFINKFNKEIAASPDSTLSLAIMDIDLFKKVNDTFGHQMGDLVLMKLAEILKKRTSDGFFPARFGGEEFVILLPGLNMEESKKVMQEILTEFSSFCFNYKDTEFHVSFSAGIAEYPMISDTVSELLSRADQALYSAKEEGRNRIYIFNQIMIRNDKFWKYLITNPNLYIDEKFQDTSSDLPYLPGMLEEIMKIDFEIKSIGTLIVKIKFPENIEAHTHYQNIRYDVENIRYYIEKSCELIFPSDMYMCLSDFFSYEFTVLFPSIFDFSTELQGFKKICSDIAQSLKLTLSGMNVEILCNSGVIFPDNVNYRKIYRDIKAIKKKKYLISSVEEKFSQTIKKTPSDTVLSPGNAPFEPAFYYDRSTGKPAYQYFVLKNLRYNSLFPSYLREMTGDKQTLRQILKTVNALSRLEPEIPVILPYPESLEAQEYLNMVKEEMDGQETTILFNENIFGEIHNSSGISGNISIGMGDCFIDKEILSIISVHDIEMIVLSENILRNIHQFRERISIVNGLKIFLDQLGIKALAPGVSSEEEYELLCDLKFSYIAGEYAEKRYL